MKPTITYDDFAKLDIALGTIVSSESVEGSEKLLKLMVEVGEETPRQIISGIHKFVGDPENLVGKQFPFILNLEPRMLMGLESQGMILAAEADGVLGLLSPETPLTPGARVH